MPHYFDVLGFRVIGDTFDGRKEINTEASVKLNVEGQILHTVSEGDGPVNALDKANQLANLFYRKCWSICISL